MPDAAAVDASPRSDGLAIAALVCGIVGVFIFPIGLVALILGIVALNKGQGRGKAIAGVVLGSVSLVLIPFILAIVAAIAIPNLLNSRVAQNETAARTTLRRSVLKNEVDFQRGCFRDTNGNSIGEYATLQDLEAANAAGHLIAMPLTDGSWHGYHFVIDVPEDTTQAEHHWIGYAWPEDPSLGGRVFCVAEDGVLRERPTRAVSARDCVEPAWDAARPGGWESAPIWPAETR